MHNLEDEGKGINLFVALCCEGNGKESLIGVVLLKDFKVEVEATGLAQ